MGGAPWSWSAVKQGVGKTALLRSFCDQAAPGASGAVGHLLPALYAPSLSGRCSPSPRVPGASWGILSWPRTPNPHQVAVALVHELRPPPPTLLVLEDLHWADEATLDVFTLLVRRAEATPRALVVGYLS